MRRKHLHFSELRAFLSVSIKVETVVNIRICCNRLVHLLYFKLLLQNIHYRYKNIFFRLHHAFMCFKYKNTRYKVRFAEIVQTIRQM